MTLIRFRSFCQLSPSVFWPIHRAKASTDDVTSLCLCSHVVSRLLVLFLYRDQILPEHQIMLTMRSLRWARLLSLTVVMATDECRLYMAKSSTSTVEEPKWGIFAGVDFDNAEQIGEPDVAIQMHNVMSHAMDEKDSEEDDFEEKSLERKSVELMERFTWVADSSGASHEVKPGGKINTAIPGTALLAAYGPKMTNAAFNHSSSYFRPALGESAGVAHPGRGASSHFYNVGMRSTTMIAAGFEIFMDYGENFEVSLGTYYGGWG